MKIATNQQPLISAVFEAAERATNDLTHLVPDLDRDCCEYAVASVLLEEAWVAGRSPVPTSLSRARGREGALPDACVLSPSAT